MSDSLRSQPTPEDVAAIKRIAAAIVNALDGEEEGYALQALVLTTHFICKQSGLPVDGIHEMLHDLVVADQAEADAGAFKIPSLPTHGDDFRDVCQQLALGIDLALNPKKHETGERPVGFGLFVFDLKVRDGVFAFASNAERQSFIVAIEEWCKRMRDGTAGGETVTISSGAA